MSKHQDLFHRRGSPCRIFTERITMCEADEIFIKEWKNIATGWKNKCLTHITTLSKVAEMVAHSDEVENTMELIKAELTKANFIKS